jgi:DNA-binding MarR family transcriptional regulator
MRANPCLLLAHLGRMAKRRVTDVLDATGIKGPHAFALMQLRDLGPISQQELAEALDLDPSKLVALLNDLESQGLAERRRDPVDRRRHIVEISAGGTKRLADAERAMAKFEDEFLRGLQPDERLQLQGLLGRVAQCLSQEDAGAHVEDAPCEAEAPHASARPA